MMLGTPGAGKSYFARNLAKHLDLKRITADEVRTRLFGDINTGRTPQNHQATYNIVNQEMQEALYKGQSVVRDNQNNHRRDRAMCQTIAREAGARAVIVWIQTPRDVAMKRCVEREDTPDQLKLDIKTAHEFYDRSMQAIETPTVNEDCVSIDGTIDFADQLKAFNEYLRNTPND